MGITAGAERSSTQSIPRMVGQALGVIAVVFLAYEAIHFYLRDPLHYIVDPTEKSFGIFWPRRLPLLMHIAGGTVALFMGPFQLWTGLRDRHMSIHRITGLFYIAGVLLGGSVGIYMSLFTVPRAFGIALFMMATTWLLAIGLAFLAIKRGRIEAHKEWMIRGYVLTFAFVTIRYMTDLPILTLLSPARDLTLGWLCWVVPLLITEVILEWRRTLRTQNLH